MATAIKLFYADELSPEPKLFHFEKVIYFRPLGHDTEIYLLNFDRVLVSNSAEEIWHSLRDDLPFERLTAFDNDIYINFNLVERIWAKKINTELEFKDGNHLWVQEDFLKVNRLIHHRSSPATD